MFFFFFSLKFRIHKISKKIHITIIVNIKLILPISIWDKRKWSNGLLNLNNKIFYKHIKQ